MITKKRWIATACLFYFLQIVNPIAPILLLNAIIEAISTRISDGIYVIWDMYRKFLSLGKLQDYLITQRDELTRKGKW